MSKEFKYVIIDELKPILFSFYNKHSEFKHVGNITSAGMCSILYDNRFIAKCYGESTSLNLKPALHDKVSIEIMLNNY